MLMFVQKRKGKALIHWMGLYMWRGGAYTRNDIFSVSRYIGEYIIAGGVMNNVVFNGIYLHDTN